VDGVALAVGTGLIVTNVVATWEQPLAFVTTTVYVPAAEAVALIIDGFCWVETKLFGPDQLYETPPVDVRLRV
jgi:hypothetical protein